MKKNKLNDLEKLISSLRKSYINDLPIVLSPYACFLLIHYIDDLLFKIIRKEI